MSAHDVRHLTVCAYCNHLGDKREMLSDPRGYLHGSCFLAEYGIEELKKKPPEQLGRLTLADIGVEAMKAILETYRR